MWDCSFSSLFLGRAVQNRTLDFSGGPWGDSGASETPSRPQGSPNDPKMVPTVFIIRKSVVLLVWPQPNPLLPHKMCGFGGSKPILFLIRNGDCHKICWASH